MSILNPENYCIYLSHRLLGQTTKQPLSNFELQKPWKYKQLWGLGPDPSCLRKNKCIWTKDFLFPSKRSVLKSQFQNPRNLSHRPLGWWSLEVPTKYYDLRPWCMLIVEIRINLFQRYKSILPTIRAVTNTSSYLMREIISWIWVHNSESAWCKEI